jgi:hypothetical protein
MAERLTTILDRAIERMEAGELIEQILADYGPYREELSPLLRVAHELLQLRRTSLSQEPKGDLQGFLEEARALRARSVSLGGSRGPSTSWSVRVQVAQALRLISGNRALRGVFAGLSVLVALFVLLGSSVVAAAHSLPGDWMYPAKIAGEELRLALIASPAQRAEYELSRVTLRVDELCRLSQAGQPVYGSTLARMSHSLKGSLLATAAAGFDQTPRLLAAIERETDEQAVRLAKVEGIVSVDPPGPGPALGDADPRQLLKQARHGLSSAHALAKGGRSDVQRFRLNASFVALQVQEAMAPLPLGEGSAPLAVPTLAVTLEAPPERGRPMPASVERELEDEGEGEGVGSRPTSDPAHEPPGQLTRAAADDVLKLDPASEPASADKPTREPPGQLTRAAVEDIPKPGQALESTKTPQPDQVSEPASADKPTRRPNPTQKPKSDKKP